MFLTNNIKTRYNLKLYSKEIYQKRTMSFFKPYIPPFNYISIKPYGNIKKWVNLIPNNKGELILENRNEDGEICF